MKNNPEIKVDKIIYETKEIMLQISRGKPLSVFMVGVGRHFYVQDCCWQEGPIRILFLVFCSKEPLSF